MRARQSHWLATIGTIAALWAQPSAAFRSTLPDIHTPITEEALKPIFTDKGKAGLAVIVSKNGDQDNPKIYDPPDHFDNETVEKGAEILATRLNDAIAALAACNRGLALEEIGKALHGLQDFYSHSNWVENHIQDDETTPAMIPVFEAIVQSDNQGKFSKGALKANAKFIAPTLDCAFDADDLPDDPFDNDLTKISTGYYPDNKTAAGKCQHLQLNKDSLLTDDFFGFNSPRGALHLGDDEDHATMHALARDPAVRATQEIFDRLLQAIIRAHPGPFLKLVELLIRDNVKIALSVDRTASMAAAIVGLRAAVAAAVAGFIAADAVPVLGLLSFADTVTEHGEVCGVNDLNAFTGLVNGLNAGGGGDCPDASLASVRQALARAESGDAVIVVTDASPRESASFAAEVSRLARARDATLSFVTGGDCGDGGTAIYQALALETGGHLFGADSTSSTNVAAVAGELFDQVSPDLVDLMLVDTTINPGSSQSWPVPVDTTISRLDVVLTRLAGGTVSLDVRDASNVLVPVTNLGLVHVARITNPAEGPWTVIVHGGVGTPTQYAVSVRALSDVALTSFRHVRTLTDSAVSEHPFAQPLSGDPFVGSLADVEAIVTGDVENPVFEFVNLVDCAVQPAPPTSTCASSGLSMVAEGGGIFAGSYAPDAQSGPVLIRLRGTDTAGNPLQRIVRRPFHRSTLSVRTPSSAPSPAALPGSSVVYDFEVTNAGPSDSFAITALTGSGFPVTVDRPTVLVGANQTATVRATVSVPSDAGPLEDPLLVLATSTTDASINNAEIATVRVPAGRLQFSAGSVSVSEGSGTATIVVNREGGSAGSVSVDYATSDGSATTSVDYTSSAGTLTFAHLETSKSFTIPVTGDADVESSETVLVHLSNFGGGALPGDADELVLTILDDDMCVAGWGAFPGTDTGVVPANADQSKCEQNVAKRLSKLVNDLIKCRSKHVRALLGSLAFDADGCAATAIGKFVDRTDTAACPCVDTNLIAADIRTALDANGHLLYCDPAGTPIGGGASGQVPSTQTILSCENRIAKEVGKLVLAWTKCHINFARCNRPLDEEACEQAAVAAFLKKIVKLNGCDGCENIPDLVDLIDAQLDGENGLVFCE